MNSNKKRRSGLAVMAGLIGMIQPLLGYMLIAIIMAVTVNAVFVGVWHRKKA